MVKRGAKSLAFFKSLDPRCLASARHHVDRLANQSKNMQILPHAHRKCQNIDAREAKQDKSGSSVSKWQQNKLDSTNLSRNSDLSGIRLEWLKIFGFSWSQQVLGQPSSSSYHLKTVGFGYTFIFAVQINVKHQKGIFSLFSSLN